MQLHQKEIDKIKGVVPEEIWDMLADLGCFIAGGALTSVFTNSEINDVDVYFPSKAAFTNAMQHIMKEPEKYYCVNTNQYVNTGFRDVYDISPHAVTVTVVTKKAILMVKDESKIQFIAHRFYQNPSEIFNDFDFTVNMAAYDMKNNTLVAHPNFLKHCAQRYLSFNENTSYPLVSALRVKKYADRGYKISKAQFLKICLAVNNKNINSWEVLIDELGGMYGTPPEEIFDTTQPFSLELAMEKLDNVVIHEKMQAKTWYSLDEIVKVMPHAFTDDLVKRACGEKEVSILPQKYEITTLLEGL